MKRLLADSASRQQRPSAVQSDGGGGFGRQFFGERRRGSPRAVPGLRRALRRRRSDLWP